MTPAARFLGTPCIHGHDGWRYVSNKICTTCAAVQARGWREANTRKANATARDSYHRNRDRNRASQKAWREKNHDLVKTRNAAFYAANPDYSAAANAKWHANNRGAATARMARWHAENKEKVRARQIVWEAANPGIRNALRAKRRADELRAAPKWVDWAAIKVVYRNKEDTQAATGVAHHVDHIVPLRGKNVCGLHVPWNLRVVTATENMSKGAKLITADGHVYA